MKMLNLFSIFDPSSSTLKMSWMMMMIPMIMLSTIKNNKTTKTIMMMINPLTKEILSSSSKKKGMMCFIMSWFTMIVIMNYSSMNPYSFATTAQISFCLMTALILFVSVVAKNMKKNPKPMMTHLVPKGSPMAMAPLMVIIELTSLLIRPITLSVRLTANIMAGHLLMSLIGNGMSTSNLFISMPAFMMMMTLEMAVAAIQAYVFNMLMSMYISELYEMKVWFPIKKSLKAISSFMVYKKQWFCKS